MEPKPDGGSATISARSADPALLDASQLSANAVIVDEQGADDILTGTWHSDALKLTLTFSEEELDLSTACNSGHSRVTIDDGVLVLDETLMHLTLCMDSDAMRSEERATAFLKRPEVYVVDGEMWLKNGDKVAKFVRP